jgi:Tol biopolymer transport system component
MSVIGKTLAHYEITSWLGKGGMGEVYQAKDRKLGRDVAIKVLPEEFARDTDRIARFQREAKLLASLNHPNIAAIHGLEESEGTSFLVLELVEGETLADQLKRGPIPVEDSLKLALQIAEALEAAHEKGVIHRDLKPSNIKVTPDGKIKVLDFGLAKAYAGDQEGIVSSDSPTLTISETQKGVILGTAAYMSPEQARGKSVDKRADIWAFGCVLYEMLTGLAAFSGKDVTDILAAVIRSEPEWSTLPANLHGRLREVLERCLKKDAKDRYHDISDVKVDIQRVLTDPSGVLVQPVMAMEPRKKLRTILPWVAALILMAIITGIGVWKLKPPEPRQVMRFEFELPEGQQFSDLTYPALAISPDGKRFVYSTAKGLYLRSVDELAAKLIAGTEGSTSQPFFSPDGKWIGFLSVPDFKLKKIDINGGAPVALCGAIPYGVSWGADSTIVYGQMAGDMMRISANGGNPESLFKTKYGNCEYPQMLPDGKSVMYTASIPQPRIVVQSLKSGERKELFAGIAARYLSTGHIVYGLSNSSNLFAIPFDLDRLEVTGGAVPIVESVISPLHYAISDSGTLAYIPGTTSGVASNQRTFVWVDQKGKEEPITVAPNNYVTPRISPDGTRVALTISTGEKSDIWIWDLGRETITRLTFDGAIAPLWTPDGKRIVFVADVDNKPVICRKAADGTGEEEKLGSVTERMASIPWSWSGDGKTLVTIDVLKEGYQGVGAVSMEGGFKWKSLLANEKYRQTVPQVSPDGRWMAYYSSESGQGEVFVRPFPEINKGRWQVSVAGGTGPLWSPDGRKLFYRNDDAVMTVAVETEPAFKPGKPEILFRGTYSSLTVEEGHPWDISPDGKRFLMMKQPVLTGAAPAAAAPRPKINIVVNWTEELKQRVPVK